MAEVITSTGFKNAVAEKGVKEVLTDYVIRIYSGTPPSTADSSSTGTLLVTITTDGATWSASSRKMQHFAITAIGSVGDTITVAVTPSSGTPESIVYTRASGDDTTDKIAIAVADKINNESKIVKAVALNDTSDYVALVSRFAGDDYTVSVTTSGTIGVGTLTTTRDNVKGNGLHFEYISEVTGGSLEKAHADTWGGTVANSGTASWFRICANNDGDTASTTAIRIQGTVSTSTVGALQMAGTTALTAGTTITIDSFSIQLSA